MLKNYAPHKSMDRSIDVKVIQIVVVRWVPFLFCSFTFHFILFHFLINSFFCHLMLQINRIIIYGMKVRVKTKKAQIMTKKKRKNDKEMWLKNVMMQKVSEWNAIKSRRNILKSDIHTFARSRLKIINECRLSVMRQLCVQGAFYRHKIKHFKM